MNDLESDSDRVIAHQTLMIWFMVDLSNTVN